MIPDIKVKAQEDAKPPRASTGGAQRKFVRACKACEACRQHKVKCDEARPLCGRCEDRAIVCYYKEQHPDRPNFRVPRQQSNRPLSIDKVLRNSRSNPPTPATTPPEALKPVNIEDEFSESPFRVFLNSSPSHRDIQFALDTLAEKKKSTQHIWTGVQGEHGAELLSNDIKKLASVGGQVRGQHPSSNSQESSVSACHCPLAGTDQSHNVGSASFVEGNKNQTWISKHHETKLSTDKGMVLHGEHSEEESDALSRSATDQASTTTRNLAESNSCSVSSSPCSSVAPSEYSAEGEDRPVIQLSLRKQELVDRLMAAFYAMFDPNSRLINHAGPSSSSPRQSTSNGSDMSASAPGSSNRDRKRKASDDNFPTRDDDGGDDGGDDGKRRRKLNSSNPNVILETSKKFACPYFKRNPRKYQRVRSCPGPGWDTVHRLKEHLYRRHALPISCPRCSESFENDTALRDHHRAAQSCEVRLKEFIEGFDKSQEKKLKSRKKSSPEQSEEDRWRNIYRILFPDDESSKVPSPYYDYDLVFDDQNNKSPRSTGFARYEEFLSRELPRQVRRELELALDQELEPIEDRLKSQLVDIVRTCQEKLFRLYQKSARNSPSTATGNGPEITHSDPPSSLSVPVQPSSSTISIDVDEQLAPYLAPPYSAFDPWPQMDEDCNFPWQLLENNAISDSGYQSLDWLAKPPSDRSQDHNSTISTSEEVWNSLEITSEKIQSSQP